MRRSSIHSPNVPNPSRGSSVGQSGGLIIRRSGVRVPTPVLPTGCDRGRLDASMPPFFIGQTLHRLRIIRSRHYVRMRQIASQNVPSGGQMVAKAFAYGLAFHAGFLGVRRGRADRIGRLSVGKTPFCAGRGQSGCVQAIRVGSQRGEGVGVVSGPPHGGGCIGRSVRGRMPHEFLDHPGRHTSLIGQRCTLATQGVEIEYQSARLCFSLVKCIPQGVCVCLLRSVWE